MKILLLSRFGRLGASSRIRSYQYISYLKQHGIDITVSPLLGDTYLSDFYFGKANHIKARIYPYLFRILSLLKSYRFDLLWIEKELFPWLPCLGELLLTYAKIPYVVDYDDAIFHRYDSHSNKYIQTFLGNKIDVIMRHANLVIVGNDYLLQHAKYAGAKYVKYLPTVVDLKKYRVKQIKNGLFTIGWIGTPITVKYLEFIRPALSELFQDNRSHLVTIGAEFSGMESNYVTNVSWSEDSEISDVQKFDVGIMPLPDNLWAKGKCGYKLIQYMACGKPVIASPVGVNSKIVEHGVNGFLANSKEEWISALTLLRDNPELRKKMGEAGRKKVEKEYCLQVTQPQLSALLTTLDQNSHLKN
ncbi:glycosyltransferase family 4 protein [Desulfococcaceae bacterium HSG9]|nr:glycosyltransferase family 4 protein [Desulfococcaceae bacterium HSG9]